MMLQKEEESINSDKLVEVHNQVQNSQDIMRQNLESAFKNTVTLQKTEFNSNELLALAVDFNSDCYKLKEQINERNRRMKIIAGLFIFALCSTIITSMIQLC